MPSPIAHTAMGYVIYRIFRPRRPHQAPRQVGLLPGLLLVTGSLSLLPDLDVVPGLLLGDVDRFHNNMTHSLMFGLIVALGVGSVVWLRQRSGFGRWFVITLFCVELHIIMDFFTIGRGIMLFWPFSVERYEPALKLFYGLHRSDGVMSVRHLWTLANELGFAVFVGLLLHIFSKNKLQGSKGRS